MQQKKMNNAVRKQAKDTEEEDSLQMARGKISMWKDVQHH